MKTAERLSREYDEARKAYHEVRDAFNADPTNVMLQRKMWKLRSKAKWAYKAYNPAADMTGFPFYSVKSDDMIEV